jgi:hypothetical protein
MAFFGIQILHETDKAILKGLDDLVEEWHKDTNEFHKPDCAYCKWVKDGKPDLNP